MRLPRKFKKCYLGKTADVGMYDTMFTTGLRLPLTELHCQLANYLGLSISPIAPNAWMIFLEDEVKAIVALHLESFSAAIDLSKYTRQKGIYNFVARKPSFRLVSDMPDFNRNWKNRYIFVQGIDWVCELEESDSIPDGFDSTWGVLNNFGKSSVSIF